jgi:hypothetical protein
MPLDLTIDLGALLEGLLGAMGGSEDVSDLALTMTMDGSVDFAGTSRVVTETGRALDNDGLMGLALQMQITEAPEDLVPAGERGPFSIDLEMTVQTAATE